MLINITVNFTIKQRNKTSQNIEFYNGIKKSIKQVANLTSLT